jgi:EmrB/QacA subfamily drug resistance transporter
MGSSGNPPPSGKAPSIRASTSKPSAGRGAPASTRAPNGNIRSPIQGRWILLATILGSGMAFIDSTVVNVALPVLQQDLHANAADVQWVVESYALFLSALILVGGALGDRFGRKRLYAIGIGLFAVASALCGLSATITELIIWRSVQGIGAALLTPGSLAIISASFPPEGRGKAIGTWSGMTAIASAVGPLVGGFLIQFSWRWIFFLNPPLAVITLMLLFQHVPESRDEDAQGPVDIRGSLLATVGLGALVFGLISAGAVGFGQPQVFLSLAIGVLALCGFILSQVRERYPMMPLNLFRSHTFSGTNLLTFFLYGALGGALYFLPFNLQKVHGYTPLQAGLSLLPFTVIASSLSRWAGGLINRYGAKIPLIVGPTIAGVGFLLFARTGLNSNYWTQYFPAVVVLALGMTITVSPLTTAMLGSVSQAHSGIASGVNNAVARTASLVAIAVFGIVVAEIFYGAFSQNLDMLHLAPTLQAAMEAQRTSLTGIQIPAGVSTTTHTALQLAVHKAFISGFRAAMLVGAVLAFVSALAAGWLVEGPFLPKSMETSLEKLENRLHQ